MSQRHPTQNECPMLITSVILGRRPVFRDDACAREAVECIYRVQNLHPFFIFGFVIMPDHCHLLVRVPEPLKISNIMASYKSSVALAIRHGSIWQKRFHIRCVSNCYAALRYIHANPVRARLCETPEAYPWSSASGKWDVTALSGDVQRDVFIL